MFQQRNTASAASGIRQDEPEEQEFLVSTHQYGPEGSASYVASMGLERIRRGQRPNLPFQNIWDEEEAFNQAAIVWFLDELACGNGINLCGVEEHAYAFTAYAQTGTVYDNIDALIGLKQMLLRDSRIKQVRPGLVLDFAGHEIPISRHAFSMNLNGTVAIVDLWVDVDNADLHRDWSRAQHSLIPSTIGPQAAPFTEADELRLEQAKQQSARHVEDAMRNLAVRRAERRAQLEAKLSGFRPLEIVEASNWQSAKRIPRDEASRKIFATVEAWMHLMQAELDEGKSFSDMALSCYQEADAAYAPPHNSTNVMVTIITNVWAHGASFSEYWHGTRRIPVFQ